MIYFIQSKICEKNQNFIVSKLFSCIPPPFFLKEEVVVDDVDDDDGEDETDVSSTKRCVEIKTTSKLKLMARKIILGGELSYQMPMDKPYVRNAVEKNSPKARYSPSEFIELRTATINAIYRRDSPAP